MSYNPTNLSGSELNDVIDWARKEFDAIQLAFTVTEFTRYKIWYSEPKKIFEGMTVLADGTEWDPGNGAGLYCYFTDTTAGETSPSWHALGADMARLHGRYETVAASQTAQVLGGSGAANDYLKGILIIPASTSPGNVLLLDGATSITIFAGGASSVADLKPIWVDLGMLATTAWKITTGANVSVIAVGDFT